MSARSRLVLAVAACLSAWSARPASPLPAPPAVPASLVGYLTRAGFAPVDIAAFAAGRPVSKLVEGSSPDQAGAIGAVRIDAPLPQFKAGYVDVAKFEGGQGVVAMSQIAVPARAEDFASLTMVPEDLDDLRSCTVRDCDVNLSWNAITRFQRIDWSAPDAERRALDSLRAIMRDYVSAYQHLGSPALIVYHDRGYPMPVAESSPRLFRDSRALLPVPHVADYFEQYRALPRPDGADEFFYWQQVTFGMKPVTRISHAILMPFVFDGRPSWAMVSRMLYASHYFRDGLELRFLIPVDARAPAAGFYFISINRSHSESLVGWKGRFIGGAIRRKVRDSIGRYVATIKTRLEAGR